jgi:3-oxoacyl-[acyl-carrier protein] reductase
MTMAGKVALITGSGRGMGLVDALLLAREGASVIVHDIDPDLAHDASDKVRAEGVEVLTLVSDVSDVAAFRRQVGEAEAHFGRIDILVNNAGISEDNTLEEVSEALFDATFDVHVKGTFFATKAVVPGMKARGGGAIVNISSIWGMAGNHSNSPYCGAKAAILGLTKAWAKELAPWNIRVNAVAPGYVMTEMMEKAGADYIAWRRENVPLGRIAEPEEMCHPVVFLASEKAGFITGQVLSANGGDTIVGM